MWSVVSPSGHFFVHIDGHTAVNTDIPPGAYYPKVGKEWFAAPGEETKIDSVYLPLVAPDTLQPVSQTDDTAIRMPQSVIDANPMMRNIEVTVPAGSLYSQDGTVGGMVGLAPVPPDRLPAPLPSGLMETQP